MGHSQACSPCAPAWRRPPAAPSRPGSQAHAPAHVVQGSEQGQASARVSCGEGGREGRRAATLPVRVSWEWCAARASPPAAGRLVECVRRGRCGRPRLRPHGQVLLPWLRVMTMWSFGRAGFAGAWLGRRRPERPFGPAPRGAAQGRARSCCWCCWCCCFARACAAILRVGRCTQALCRCVLLRAGHRSPTSPAQRTCPVARRRDAVVARCAAAGCVVGGQGDGGHGQRPRRRRRFGCCR